ncbi:MAG: AEC family transporter [Atribacterota bacterium]|nr:AEC family transporter [Atribacterota bacterium]
MIVGLMKTFFILVAGTFSGYFLQKILAKNQAFTYEKRKKISITLQKISMIGLISITYIGSLWIFNIENIMKAITMPFVGIFFTVTGGILAVFLSKYLNYTHKDTGSMFSCGYFSNRANLGALICFFFLGEPGYALVPIFSLFMHFMYYGVGYPVAHMYNDEFAQEKELKKRLLEVIKDPFFYMGITTVLIGLLLNLSPFKRPPVYGKVNEILIPLSTFISLFSIGLTLKLGQVFKYTKEIIYISIIKFFIVPALTLAIVVLLGYQSLNQGLPLKVALILSAMPVAFNSVVAANVYDLNVDLVNSCWIITTFSVLLVLPIILHVVELF